MKSILWNTSTCHRVARVTTRKCTGYWLLMVQLILTHWVSPSPPRASQTGRWSRTDYRCTAPPRWTCDPGCPSPSALWTSQSGSLCRPPRSPSSAEWYLWRRTKLFVTEQPSYLHTISCHSLHVHETHCNAVFSNPLHTALCVLLINQTHEAGFWLSH